MAAIDCGLMSIARDHAAGLHQQQDEVACGEVTAGARTMHFPRYEMARWFAVREAPTAGSVHLAPLAGRGGAPAVVRQINLASSCSI
jgi:hypothetical protein